MSKEPEEKMLGGECDKVVHKEQKIRQIDEYKKMQNGTDKLVIIYTNIHRIVQKNLEFKVYLKRKNQISYALQKQT